MRTTYLVRYSLWVALGIAAAFLVVASASFALTAIQGLALGIGIGTLVMSLGLAAFYRSNPVSLVTGLVSAAVSGWMIVESQVFSLPAVQNLTLAASLAIAGLALVGLTAHELTTERVVHSLEVQSGQRESEPIAA
jgi:hypothetical protein